MRTMLITATSAVLVCGAALSHEVVLSPTVQIAEKGSAIERRVAQLDSAPMPQLRSLTVITHKGDIACTRKYLPKAYGTRVSVDCEE
jgi:hypothetical protein